VASTHKEIFERYIYAGAITRDPAAFAALFTEDGVYEAPLVPAGHSLPGRLAGRAAIRAGIGAVHEWAASHPGTLNRELTRFALHDTADPGVFIAEIDTVLDQAGGERTTMSLVQIFRVRDGQIARLRDYFDPSA
jgi:ketosteroid isomerase-like protein